MKTFLTLFIFLLVGFSGSVFALDTSDCIKIKDDTKRLTCFDEIYSSSNVIAHFEGQSVSTNTLPFITEDSWEIHWSYTADEENPMKQFLISIVNQNTEVLNVPVMHYGETESGVSYYPKKGKYYLTVVATGSWSVTIMSSN